VDARTKAKIEQPSTRLLEMMKEEGYVCWTTNKPTCKFNTRIDYILASKKCAPLFTVSQPPTIDSSASDHKALTVEISTKGDNQI
jgi:exonuclease III